jgi:predicted ATPase/class 3 adenylate cyclase
MNVERWLIQLGLGEYAPTFEANGIDANLLTDLTNEDLKDMGISRLSDRKKILSAISTFATSKAAKHDTLSASANLQIQQVERRQLTVLFVDMVGSTDLSYRLDPEDLREVLVEYQSAIATAVQRYGGYVAKYSGDGVLAYFCWPQAREDQAERAVRAGLGCLKAVSLLKLEDGGVLRSRAGIATGQVVIGETDVESDAVVGETPNLAARLQTIAEPNEVVIDQTTRNLIGQAFVLTDRGRRRLRGINDPVPVWSVISEQELGNRFEHAHSSRLTPFVGRNHEVGQLLDKWNCAKGGHGQVVILFGEAGIGKSRMVRELQAAITSDSPGILYFQCSPLHSSSALYPLIQHLERCSGFLTDDTPEVKMERLDSFLSRQGDDLSKQKPFLAALLNLTCNKRRELQKNHLSLAKRRVLNALAAYISSSIRGKPTLLVFEDVHWIDPSSRDLLELVVDQLKPAPVLLIVTCRSEFRFNENKGTFVSGLELGRLDYSHASKVVVACGGSNLTHNAVATITRRADGVPLFLEELANSMNEAGSQLDEMDIPVSLQASLKERLDRLSEARDIASVGAVIGREFSYSILTSLLDVPEDKLRLQLDRLVDSGLVFVSLQPPNSYYTFKHSLVQDIAYHSLLKRRRRQLHLRIGTILEKKFPSISRAEPELIAHHFELGQETAKALSYWIEAGDRAKGIPAPSEAKSHYWRALNIVQELPESPDTRSILMNTIVSLLRVSHDIGGSMWRSQEEQRRALPLIENAMQTAEELGDLSALALLEADQAGRLESEELFATALTHAEIVGDHILQANIAFRYSGFLGRSGSFLSSQTYSKQAIELYGKLEEDVQKGFAMAGAGRCYTARAGKFKESLYYAAEVRKIAKDTGDPRIRSWIAMEAEPYWYKGDWQSAARAVEMNLSSAWQIGNWQVVLFASAWATMAYIKLSRLDEARSLIEQALEGADEVVGYDFPRTWARLAFSQMQLHLGNLEEARSAANWALKSAKTHSHPLEHGAALRVLGQIDEKEGNVRNADRHYQSSLEILGAIQSGPELAQSQLAYGRFVTKQNENEGKRLLKVALKHFQEMKAKGWIEETRIALKT